MRTEAGTMDPKDVRELEQLLLMRKSHLASLYCHRGA